MIKDDGVPDSRAVPDSRPLVTPWRSHDKLDTPFDDGETADNPSTRAQTNSTIVVIDRRPLVRECLCLCLEQTSGLHVVAVSSVADWLDSPLPASLVLYHCAGDPTGDEIKADLARLIERPGSPPVSVLSDGDNLERITTVMDQGVRAYIPTSSTLAVMLEAIRMVRAGGLYVPASSILSRRTFGEALAAPCCRAPAVFTNRQVAVIEALRRGKANKIIAHELNMRESTVKVHVRNIMKKLNVKNRTEVAYLANQFIAAGAR